MQDAPHPRTFAARTPDKPALVMADTGESITYGQLIQRSAQAANLFAALGVQSEDTVAFFLENHIRYAELAWGAKDSGLRYVAISSHLNAADAAYILTDCSAKVLVTSWALRETAQAAVAQLEHKPALLMIDGAEAPFESYEAALDKQPATPMQGRPRGASMLYSSGTTGRPKGIRTAIETVPPEVPPKRFPVIVKQYEFGPEMRFFTPAPFYHSGPLRFMMMTHRCGGTFFGFRKFEPAAALAALGRHSITHAFFVPTMFARMLRLEESVRQAADVLSLQHAIHSSAPCPVEVKRAMIAWWGPVIDEIYSGTEGIGHTFISSSEWLAHPGSVGRPAANCLLRIVGPDGQDVLPGAAGRIMMANGLDVAYHNGGQGVSIRDADGFASLGDVGYLDEDGYLYLTDRESHMIISGGVNIYPQEAEAVLVQHPLIEDVAVIGVPNEDMGEEVKAVIQLRAAAVPSDALKHEILDFCRERLSALKCPRTIDFIEALPRNEMGKLVKREVRARYWSHTGRLI